MRKSLRGILLGAAAIAAVAGASAGVARAKSGGQDCEAPKYDRFGCLCAIGSVVTGCRTLGGFPGRTYCDWDLPCLFPRPFPFLRGFRI